MKKAYFWLILITIVWGTTFPLQKLALNGISTSTYISLRFWIASIVSFVVWRKHSFKYGVILGLVFAGSFIAQTYGLSLTTASKNGFITSLYIIMVPFFSYMIEKEKPSVFQYFGFPMALLGSYFMAGGLSGFNLGDLLTFISAVGYAVHIVLLTIISKKVDETSILSFQFLTVAVITTFMSIGSGVQYNYLSVSVAAYTAIFATVIATFLQARYQKVVSSNTAALIFVGEPIFSAFFSFLILKEQLSSRQFFGAAILIGALVFASFRKKQQQPL